jgi:hypothetical protein
MYEIIKGNEIILQFVSDNWIILLLFYSIVRGMFPDSKLIQIIGASFASMFPVLRKK